MRDGYGIWGNASHGNNGLSSYCWSLAKARVGFVHRFQGVLVKAGVATVRSMVELINEKDKFVGLVVTGSVLPDIVEDIFITCSWA